MLLVFLATLFESTPLETTTHYGFNPSIFSIDTSPLGLNLHTEKGSLVSVLDDVPNMFLVDNTVANIAPTVFDITYNEAGVEYNSSTQFYGRPPMDNNTPPEFEIERFIPQMDKVGF